MSNIDKTIQNQEKKANQILVSDSFESIMADKNGTDKILQLLKSSKLERNKLPIDQFKSKYEILFLKGGAQKIGYQRYQQIGKDYIQRINPYDPVMLVDYDGQIIITLPAIFHRVNSISQVGQAGSNILQAFVNSCELTDIMSEAKKQKYLKYFSQLLGYVQNAKKRQDTEKQTQQLVQKVITYSSQSKEQNVSQIIDLEPEQEIKQISDFNNNLNQISSAKNKKTNSLGDEEIEIL